MTNQDDKRATKAIDIDDKTPLDLRGSEQHHDLKNNPGEKGKVDHSDSGGPVSQETRNAAEGVLADGDPETAVSSALKAAVKD